jgi:hypothetical protein
VLVNGVKTIVDSSGCHRQCLDFVWVTVPPETAVDPSDENNNGRVDRQGYMATCGLRGG